MSSTPNADLVSTMEDLLARGVRNIVEAEDRQEVEELIEQSGDADLCAEFRRALSGEASPESLVHALDAIKRRALSDLQPLRFDDAGSREDRRAALEHINAAAGAPPPESVDGERTIDRLPLLAPHKISRALSKTADIALLWCLVRTGRIAERRAALQRLGALLLKGRAEETRFADKDLISGLSEIRDPRIAYEVDRALAALPGSAGRSAKHRLGRADRLLTRVHESVLRYWEGGQDTDPLDSLVREEWLRLGVWLRRGSEELSSHVSEHLRQQLFRGDAARMTEAVGALIPAGDVRLVPMLVRVLVDGPLPARIATARALARIADPRVQPVLVKAYRHATDVMEKTVLGGALGQFGDDRALPFLLEQLEENDPPSWEEIIRSLGEVGNQQASHRLLPFLESERPALARAALASLIRCGGPEALESVEQMSRRPGPLGPIVNDAVDAIALRLELSGALGDKGERREFSLARRPKREEAISDEERPESALWARLRSVGHYFVGLFWAALWQRGRALDSFTIAARLNPGAATPHLREATIHAANSRDDLAIDAYKRGLEANRPWVLDRPTWVRKLGRAYVRRADQLVARRRKREALALLDELASLDLRHAGLDVRLALARRRDRLLVDRPRQGKAG